MRGGVVLRSVFFFLFILLAVPGVLGARSLYWQDMNVSATLDRDGRLHVLEQQTMVFSGGWNGGERRFNLRSGQRLTLHNIYRINPGTGARISLVRGDLSRVDHWVRYNDNKVRWRARLPSDPPFTNKTITYQLEYTLSGILFPVDEGGYQFRHDFAFPNRNGVIKHFSLDLTLDPSWRVEGDLPTHVERSSLPPGTSVILSAILQHPGGVPAEVGKKIHHPQRVVSSTPAPVSALKSPRLLQVVVIVSLWIFVLVQGMNFLAHERKRGRFHPLVPVDDVNESWLGRHVFTLAPEVVGAIWDKRTASSEVAAVLARMVQEKKMSSRVEQEVVPLLGWKIPGLYTLHLRLLVPRSTLRGYERELVDGLFIDGDATSTKKVKKYYRRERTIFNPVEKIRKPLRNKVEALTKDRKNSQTMLWIPTLFLAAASFFLFFADFFLYPQEHVPELLTVGAMVVIWMIGVNLAIGYRATAQRVETKAYLLYFFTTGIAAGYMTMLLMVDGSTVLMLGSAFMCAALINNILNQAGTRDSEEGVRLHRYLASARKYFKQELARQSPKINDDWFPYLVAFGLGPQVDSWFRRYGGHSTYTGSSISGGAHSGFTGGGGQFGGGGVTGAWSAAAGSMGASTSGGSGGSGGFGGGGGGSGGGGGGGF